MLKSDLIVKNVITDVLPVKTLKEIVLNVLLTEKISQPVIVKKDSITLMNKQCVLNVKNNVQNVSDGKIVLYVLKDMSVFQIVLQNQPMLNQLKFMISQLDLFKLLIVPTVVKPVLKIQLIVKLVVLTE